MLCSAAAAAWFPKPKAQNIPAVAAVSALAISGFPAEASPLEQANEAMSATNGRHGDFTNIVATP